MLQDFLSIFKAYSERIHSELCNHFYNAVVDKKTRKSGIFFAENRLIVVCSNLEQTKSNLHLNEHCPVFNNSSALPKSSQANLIH